MRNDDAEQDIEASKQSRTSRLDRAPKGFELCYRDSVTGEILVPGMYGKAEEIVEVSVGFCSEVGRD